MASRPAALTPFRLCLLLIFLAVSLFPSPATASQMYYTGVSNLADLIEFDPALAASRRLLQYGGYISYGALQRDRVPCPHRGCSYYNCRPGAQANPYDRGCSAITQCRG